MNPKIILIAISIVTLAGCSLAPPYTRPELPAASVYPQVTAEATQAMQDVEQLEWQEFFTDARLQELIAQALENNRDLRIALARIDEARGLYGVQRAAQFPFIDAGIAGGRSRMPGDLSPTGRSVTSSQYEATLSLSFWELDLWGRVRDLSTAALESFLATEEAQRGVTISLIAQIANAYLLDGELNELVNLAEHTLSTRAQSYDIMQRRYEMGATSKLNAVQAETLWHQARSDLKALLRQRELNRNALTLLVGVPGIDFKARPLSQIEPGFMQELTVGLPSDLLLDRPDIVSAEHRLKAANANIGAARAAFFPNIGLTGNLGTASAELDGLFGSDSSIWRFTPSLTLPIFHGGRNRANLDVAEARRNMAVSDYERTIQRAFREVADGLAERYWLGEQVADQKASLTAQTERARLAQLRYQNGAAPYLEVLDAERDRFAAEQALVQIRRALLSSNVNLYVALGGGIRQKRQ